MAGRRIQRWRRAVQISVIALIAAVPLLNLVRIDVVQGTLCSIGIRSIDVTCSLGALQVFLASRTVYLPLLLSSLAFIVLVLVLGRVFCSWICPQHVVSEAGDGVRKILRPGQSEGPDSLERYRRGRNLLFSILGLGLLATFVFGVPVICYICPIGIICRQFITGTFLGKIGGETLIVLTIVLVEITIARRGWCRYICPVGAFYSIFITHRGLKIKRNRARCAECGSCEKVCPMGDSPLQGRIGRTCTNCAICVDDCPEGALGFTFFKRS